MKCCSHYGRDSLRPSGSGDDFSGVQKMTCGSNTPDDRARWAQWSVRTRLETLDPTKTLHGAHELHALCDVCVCVCVCVNVCACVGRKGCAYVSMYP